MALATSDLAPARWPQSPAWMSCKIRATFLWLDIALEHSCDAPFVEIAIYDDDRLAATDYHPCLYLILWQDSGYAGTPMSISFGGQTGGVLMMSRKMTGGGFWHDNPTTERAW